MSVKVSYVCKYTPLELLAGFGCEWELMDRLAETYETAGRMTHDNLCGFGKSMLEQVLEERPKELVLVNCCDTMRRTHEAIRETGICDFLFLMDLPHRQTCCAAEKLADEFLRLKQEYEKYSGRRFNTQAFLDAVCRVPEKTEEGPYIGILGVRCGEELENTIRSLVPGNVRNLTCARNRKVFLGEAGVKHLDETALIRAYARAVLEQFPCGRMGLNEKRRELFSDPNLKGVIYHTIKFCDYYEMEYLQLKKTAEFPVVKLETDYTRQSEGQLKTRIEAFAETLTGLGGNGSNLSDMAAGSAEAKGKAKRTAGGNMFVAGIDSGSTSTDVVILDENKKIKASVIIPTGGGANISAEEALREALEKADLSAEDISNIVKTGYGRDYIEAGDNSITEITCHAKGAHFLDPSARTVIDIGGQDSKVIKIDENGAVLNFVMNDKCAAGTGRFLEMMARALGFGLDEMSTADQNWKEEIHISSMCTVFAESEVVSLVAQNKEVADIVHGLNHSVAAKVSSLAKRVAPEEGYIMTGGVANNQGVVKALEETLGAKLFICEEAQLCGALGAALFALEQAAG